MKALAFGITLLFAFSSASVLFHFHNHEILTLWNQWKIQYGKSYSSAEEEAYRLKIFHENHNLIQAWNSEGHTSTMAINKFADLTREEFASMYTTGYAIPNQGNYINFDNSETFGWPPKPKPKPLPSSWDWRTLGGVTSVKDQGGCGADYAFSAVGALETTFYTMGNFLTDFSEQQVVDCDHGDHACQGGAAPTAMSYSEEEGNEPSDDYPWNGNKGKCQYNSEKAQNITNGPIYIKPDNSTDFMTGIVLNTVSVVVDAAQPVWQFYNGGVITANCSTEVNHWVLAVGYGNYTNVSSYFIKNSWGNDWGVAGYVYIGQNNEEYQAGTCGILTQPVFPFPNIEPGSFEEMPESTYSSFTSYV